MEINSIDDITIYDNFFDEKVLNKILNLFQEYKWQCNCLKNPNVVKDVKKGINDLIDEIRTSKSRVREAYDSTYEYRTQQGTASAQPASTGGWSVVR